MTHESLQLRGHSLAVQVTFVQLSFPVPLPMPICTSFHDLLPKCRPDWLFVKLSALCLTTRYLSLTVSKEHAVFLSLTCRSGAGGRGEIAEKGGGRMVDNFKYQPGGSLPKRIWLNNSDPADGHEGSSIMCVMHANTALAPPKLLVAHCLCAYAWWFCHLALPS